MTQRWLVENLDDLKTLLKTINDTSEKAGLRLNIKKTKVMTTCELHEFKLDTNILIL